MCYFVCALLRSTAVRRLCAISFDSGSPLSVEVAEIIDASLPVTAIFRMSRSRSPPRRIRLFEAAISATIHNNLAPQPRDFSGLGSALVLLRPEATPFVDCTTVDDFEEACPWLRPGNIAAPPPRHLPSLHLKDLPLPIRLRYMALIQRQRRQSKGIATSERDFWR